MATHVMNIYAKFHRIPSTTERDIESREMVLTDNCRTGGLPQNVMPLAASAHSLMAAEA